MQGGQSHPPLLKSSQLLDGLFDHDDLSQLALWSLDFGVGVFHDFSRMNFGRNELMQGRTLTPQQVKRADEFHLKFVIAGADFGFKVHAYVGTLTGKLKLGFFTIRKQLRIACFPYMGFS